MGALCGADGRRRHHAGAGPPDPAWEARTAPLEVVLQNGRPLDPIGDPEGTRAAVDRLVGAGATGLQLGFVHHSLDHYLEQLGALARLVESGPA